MNTIKPLLPFQNIQTGSESPASNATSHKHPLTVQPGLLLEALVIKKHSESNMLLQIGGNKIAVESRVPLKPEETLQLQVVSTSPEIQLKILDAPLRELRNQTLTVLGKSFDVPSIIKMLQHSTTMSTQTAQQNPVTSQPATNAPQTASLKNASLPETQQQQGVNNAPLPALARPIPGSNQLILQRGEQQLQVIPATPVSIAPAGQQIQVQMQNLSPLQIQIIVEQQEKTISIPVTLSTNTPLAPRTLNSFFPPPGQTLFEILSPQAQQTFNSYLAQQTTPPEGKDSGATLQHLLTRLGLAFESQIAEGKLDQASQTLKAALIEAAHLAKTEHTTMHQTAGNNAIHQAVSMLELFQLAHLQNTSEQQAIFPLPFSFLEQGYLRISNNDTEKQQKQGTKTAEKSFSLYLQMTGLGNIKISFLQSAGGVAIRFDTDNTEKAEFVKRFDQELRDSITQYTTTQLTFGTEAKDPGNELGRQILGEGETVLDTRI